MKATLLIALLIGTGGTSFAAQGAVPGEFLYGVKVGVNENIKSAFAVNADAQAELQSELLAERLEEAQKLASKGDLEGELETEVRTNINAQLEKTLAASTEASAVTEVAVRTEVSDTLAHFRNEVARLQLNSAETNILASYSVDVSSRANRAPQAEAQMDSATTMAMSADADATTMNVKMVADVSAQALIENAQVRIEGLSKTLKNALELSAEVKMKMEADLKIAVKYIADANASLRANAEEQAQTQAQSALEVVGKVESALSLMGEVEIDAETGSIIDFNLGGSGSAGSGTSGTSGSGVYTDPGATVEGSTGASLEGDMIDSPMDVQSSSEASGNFGF